MAQWDEVVLPSSPELGQHRQDAFGDELSDPEVKKQFDSLIHNEVGSQGKNAQTAFAESVFNRALARNKSLRDTINDPHYYPPQSLRFHPDADYTDAIDSALRGSDISGGSTGNASGHVGFAGGPMTARYGGEKFGVEGPDAGKMAALKQPKWDEVVLPSPELKSETPAHLGETPAELNPEGFTPKPRTELSFSTPMAQVPMPGWLQKPVRAVGKYAEDMIPKGGAAVEGDTYIDRVKKLFGSQMNVEHLVPGADVVMPLVHQGEARAEQVQAAEQTPAWSQERWDAGIGTVADILQLGAGARAGVGAVGAAERMIAAKAAAEAAKKIPPPIPPEYLERRFTMPAEQSGISPAPTTEEVLAKTAEGGPARSYSTPEGDVTLPPEVESTGIQSETARVPKLELNIGDQKASGGELGMKAVLKAVQKAGGKVSTYEHDMAPKGEEGTHILQVSGMKESAIHDLADTLDQNRIAWKKGDQKGMAGTKPLADPSWGDFNDEYWKPPGYTKAAKPVPPKPLEGPETSNYEPKGPPEAPSVAPGAPPTSQMGVRESTLQERAKRRGTALPEPGVGRSWEQQVEEGQRAVESGRLNPDQIASDFLDKGQHPSPDEFQALRYRQHQLQLATDAADEALASDPGNPELQNAVKEAETAEHQWRDQVIKPVKTATSKTMEGMKGEQFDPTSVRGLARSAEDAGNPITEKQVPEAQDIAKDVSDAHEQLNAAQDRVVQAWEKEYGGNKTGKYKSAEQLKKELADVDPCKI